MLERRSRKGVANDVGTNFQGPRNINMGDIFIHCFVNLVRTEPLV